MTAPTPEQLRALADDRRSLEKAIGYDPVPLSIRNHPEIRFEYRTAADRDGLVDRILAAGFTQAALPRTNDDVPDAEQFCARCYAGVDSGEHHEKCVITGYAADGESAKLEPRRGDVARLKVQRGDLTEWPLAERVKNGWQNGVTFYPDADVVEATLYTMEVRR